LLNSSAARGTGLALNSEDNLTLIDTGGSWPPSLITYTQDGRLVRSVDFLPLKGCTTPHASKCRFMECIGDSVVVVDLGMFSFSWIHNFTAATWSLKFPKVPFLNTWSLMSLNLKKWSRKSLFLCNWLFFTSFIQKRVDKHKATLLEHFAKKQKTD